MLRNKSASRLMCHYITNLGPKSFRLVCFIDMRNNKQILRNVLVLSPFIHLYNASTIEERMDLLFRLFPHEAALSSHASQMVYEYMTFERNLRREKLIAVNCWKNRYFNNFNNIAYHFCKCYRLDSNNVYYIRLYMNDRTQKHETRMEDVNLIQNTCRINA